MTEAVSCVDAYENSEGYEGQRYYRDDKYDGTEACRIVEVGLDTCRWCVSRSTQECLKCAVML